MKKFFLENKSNVWFWLFIVVAAVLMVAMPLMSLDAGNSGDEDKFQIPQGRFVMDYYSSGGQDTTCLKDVVTLNGKEQNWNLKYYGCSFDVVTEWINRTLEIDDIARTRHVCNSLMGWLIIFFGGLIAYRVGGWRAGLFAMLLLFFSPRLLGHSFNNPKDIPFAAGIVMCIYYIMMFFRQVSPSSTEDTVKGKKQQVKVEYPQLPFSEKTTRIIAIVAMVLAAVVLFPTAGVALALLLLLLMVGAMLIKNTPHFNPLTLFMLALSLALAVSNRIGALIVVGYMGLWGLLWLVRYRRQLKGAVVVKTVIVAVCTCAVGFFAGLLLWPYAMQSPVSHAIESFKLMSQFDVQLRQLFEGTMVMSSNLPWYYTPKFMLITIPVAVMIGWVIYPFFGAFGKQRWLESAMLYFCFLFPVFWIVVTGANVYGGWRHSLFTYPPMAVVAALGFDMLASWAGGKSGKKTVETLVSLVPVLLLVSPAVHTFRNHPYEYVYFNEIEGGVKKAFGHYELDYYYHSMREATEWVLANAEPRPDGEKTLVGSWHVESTRYFMRGDTAHFATRFVRWGQRYEYDWDYLVFPITGISGSYLLGEKFPPSDCVHTVNVDNVPIALVLKRRTKDDFYAVRLLKEGKIDSAVALMEKVLEDNPDNEAALANLANISLQRGEAAKAAQYCEHLRTVDPTNQQAAQILVYAYLGSGRQQEAATLLEKLKAEGDNAFAYTITARLFAQKGDLGSAIAEINAMLDKGLMDQESLGLYVQIRMSQGMDQNGATYAFYSAYANGLEKSGDSKNAENIRRQLGIVR